MIDTPDIDAVRHQAAAVLEAAWEPFRGYSFPHAHVYGHMWLWDSCFHAIAWAALGDVRAIRELEAVFAAQLPDGFVPHMRYSEPSQWRGPLDYASGFTQPPVYAMAATALQSAGLAVAPALVAHITQAFEWLWSERLTTDGLLKITHPWEAGADDSPRWDGWIGSVDWNRPQWTALDIELVGTTQFSEKGAAVTNTQFEVAPAAFNAIAAHGMRCLARIGGPSAWSERATKLSTAIDGILWDEEAGLWVDLAVVGPADTVAVPTLDGVLPSLATLDPDRAHRALDQLQDKARFAAPYGLAYVAKTHPTYRSDLYWRGAAWPQMNHLARVAAVRWDRHDLAAEIAAMTRRGAMASGFGELWDPETGEARGAVPQTWTALAAVDDIDQPAALA